MVRHHLPQELLLSFASGTCLPGECLLVATHLTLCPICREEVAELEDLGGALLDEIDDGPLEAGLFERTLARLYDDDKGGVVEAPPIRSDGVFPRSLLELVGPMRDIEWTTRLVGRLRYIELPFEHAGLPMRIKCLKGGLRIPEHSHEDREVALYLAGGATDLDTSANYRRGDVSICEAGESHRLEVDPGEDCIVLGTDARLIATDMRSRLFFWLMGRS